MLYGKNALRFDVLADDPTFSFTKVPAKFVRCTMTLSESTLGNDVCTLYQSCSIFRGWTAYAWSWKLPIGQFLHHHWITMKYRACMILHFLDLVNEICCQRLILFSSFADAHRKGCWVRERAQAAIIVCSVKGLSFMWLRTSKHHVPYCTIRLEHLPLGYAVSNFIFLHLLSFNKKQTCKFGSYLHTAMTQPKKTPFDLAREERFCQQLSMQ